MITMDEISICFIKVYGGEINPKKNNYIIFSRPTLKVCTTITNEAETSQGISIPIPFFLLK